jgi:rRNA small subunit pseudouridine methyltransferase Nep1
LDSKSSLLSIILVDSELELVPKEYWSHPAVVANAKKRNKRSSKVLLDTNFHHSIFKDPAERNRRGRPDIVHQFLLIGLESMLNIDGGLRLYVHTRNDEMITISPETRLPKNYNRFQGLFEELFRSGVVPDADNPLIKLNASMDLKKVFEKVAGEGPEGAETISFTLDPAGKRVSAYELMGTIGKDKNHVICLIGGFPSGEFRSDPERLSNGVVSFHEKELKAWSVEMELISAFYNTLF